MSELQARTAYPFEGDAANGELSFDEGEFLTIIRQDVGDGWWEARKESGESGLIPEAYMEIVAYPEPSMPPPPPPPEQTFVEQPPMQTDSLHTTDTNSQSQVPIQNSNHSYPQTQQSYEDDDRWDDEWDDDDASSTSEQPAQGNFGLSQPSREYKAHSDPAKPGGTVKKSFSRFSTFAKSGGEAYMLGIGPSPVVPEKCVKRIIVTENGFEWEPLYHEKDYHCTVTSPKKSSKLKGLKSFIAYQLIPSFSGIQVSRRYKHFDWLHERLAEKFPTIAIPPLPDKQISGRYEDDFIAERMRQLTLWVSRMCKHPIISTSDVFVHFISSTDEKDWKQGKRKAEKDEFQGGKWFLTVQHPTTIPLDQDKTETDIDSYYKFIKSFDDGVKHMLNVTQDSMRKHAGPFKKEFQKVGHAFEGLAKSFEMDERAYGTKLTVAVKKTGETYRDIGTMFENQPKNDLLPLLEGLFEYKGMLSAFPDILQVQKAAMVTIRDCKKAEEDQKMTPADVLAVQQRGDVVSYATLAEMNYFSQKRVKNFKDYIRNYLKEQIQFYQEITNKLQETLNTYDET